MNYHPKYIPGEGKIGSNILIVGEAPGETEHDMGRPFVGESGRILRDALGRNGIDASNDCYITNICHYRPVKNNFKLVIDTPALAEGIAETFNYIKQHRPNVVVPLGNYALKYITGRIGIKKWRGSIINAALVDKDIKAIPTLHPAFVLRDGTNYPTFDLDFKRISDDATYPERRLPERRFIINPRGMELEEWTQRLCQSEYLGIDIETIKNSSKILCVGFAPSPQVAVCLSTDSDSNRQSIRRILESGYSKKIFQFGTFDTIQLIHLNGYALEDAAAKETNRPYYWDTNNAQHILAPELPRSLEYLSSIYTREPYYKTVGRGTIPDDEKGWSEKVEKQSLYEYNCRDCCCTIEVALQQMEEIKRNKLDSMFSFGMSMIEVTRHVSVSGMYQDEERRALIERVIYYKWSKKQAFLNAICQEKEVNVRSPKLKDILYKKLGLPPRYKDKKVTTNEDAIVSLIGYCKGKEEEVKQPAAKVRWEAKTLVCNLILEIRGLRVLLSNYIRLQQKNKVSRTGSDGRIRSTYKVCGTETGRWSCSKFVDGTGFNSQTLPRDPIEVDDFVYSLVMQEMKDTDAEKMKKAISELDVDEVDDVREEDDENEEAA